MDGDPQGRLLAGEAVRPRADRREDPQRLGDQRMAAAIETAQVDRRAGVQLHERLPARRRPATSARGQRHQRPSYGSGPRKPARGRSLGQGDRRGDQPLGEARACESRQRRGIDSVRIGTRGERRVGRPDARSMLRFATPAPSNRRYGRGALIEDEIGHIRPPDGKVIGSTCVELVHVVGARPNFVKMAPVIDALARHDDVVAARRAHRASTTTSGCRPRCSRISGCREPDVFLGVGSGTHGAQTARALERVRGGAARSAPRSRVRGRRRQLDARRRAGGGEARDPGRARRGGTAVLRLDDARGDQPRPHRPPVDAAVHAQPRGGRPTSRPRGSTQRASTSWATR